MLAMLLGLCVSAWASLGVGALASSSGAMSCTAASCAPTYTAEYKGTFSFNQDFEGAGSSAGTFLRTKDTLTWDEKVITTASNPKDPSTWRSEKTLVASGSTTVVSSNSPSFTCTLAQSANPNLSGLSIGPNALKSGRVNVSAIFPADLLTASGGPLCFGLTDYDCTDTGCVGVCTDNWSSAEAAKSQAFDDAVTPSLGSARSPLSKPYGATQTASSNCLQAINGPPKSTGTETVTRSIQGTLTIGGSCSASPAVVRVTQEIAPAHIASGRLKVKATSNAPGDFFRAFKVTLKATASGGCRPYHFKWTRVNQPTPKIPGVKVTVDPKTVTTKPDPAVSLLPVDLTCTVTHKVKDQYGISDKSRFMTPCWGPVTYRVDVKDTPKSGSPKKGADVVFLHWAPECLPDDLRKEYKQERTNLEHELYKELVKKYGESFTIEKLVEYVGAGEFAPAFFLKDLAEISIEASKAFQRAAELDEILTEPPC
ncbi:MAG: hypothetical protein ACXVSL_04730 [Solirubrobacteraceae bacterium]